MFKPLDYKYIDATSGSTFLNAMEIMKSRFHDKYQNNLKNVIMICLVLSFFCDGIQVWKSKVATFAPAFLAIMNLPPAYRNKLGIGSNLL